jgi:phosphoglycerol transferase
MGLTLDSRQTEALFADQPTRVASFRLEDRDSAARKPSWRRVAAQYGLAAVLTLGLLAFTQRLWQHDFTAPLQYDGDGLQIQTWWKAVIDHGWFLHNPNLGAPHGQEMEDYPLCETANFVLVKCFAWLTHDIVQVTNMYILSTFVLATLGSLAALRQMGVAYLPALVVSILYSFMPYHFYRLTGHHLLANYCVVPLSSLLALWVYEGRVRWPFAWPRLRAGAAEALTGTPVGKINRLQRFLLDPATSGASDQPRPASWPVMLGICLAQASTGIYYAVFALYFLFIAGVAAALRQHRFRPLFGAGLLIAVTGAVVVTNLAPSLIYRARHGVNTDIATRWPREAEWFGYKMAASLLPMPDHKIDALSNLRWSFERETTHSNEGAWAAQGLIANLGYMTLLGLLLYRRRAWQWLEGLSVLHITGILLGTIGGLGMVFNMLVSAQIRSYNRISIFLSFFSLACVALVLQQLWQRYEHTKHRRRLVVAGLAALLAFGIWDQYPRTMRPDYGRLHRRWHRDAEFVKDIERALPTGAMVYQLPFTRYPESPAVLAHHAHFAIRFYLHSDTLRWSTGACRGREGDAWQMKVAELPLEEQLETLAEAGFRGIQISRNGYADNGAEIECQLSALLDVKPIESEIGEESFFSMETYLADRAAKKERAAAATTARVADQLAAQQD